MIRVQRDLRVRDLHRFGADEWEVAFPALHRVLNSPESGESFLVNPDEEPGNLLAYWNSLLYMLVYSLGWARPDCGLRWWLMNDTPTYGDARLRLLERIWLGDGRLDEFLAWTSLADQFSPTRGFMEACGYVDQRSTARDEPDWLDWCSRVKDAWGPGAPFAGGADPLHLSLHLETPLTRDAGGSTLLRSGTHDRTAVLVLDRFAGWYRHLMERGSSLPDIGIRSWRVEVVVKPVGFLGTYRRSRESGLWFSGRHSLHIRGA